MRRGDGELPFVRSTTPLPFWTGEREEKEYMSLAARGVFDDRDVGVAASGLGRLLEGDVGISDL